MIDKIINCNFCGHALSTYEYVVPPNANTYYCIYENCQNKLYIELINDNCSYWSVIINERNTIYSDEKSQITYIIQDLPYKELLKINQFIKLPNDTAELNLLLDRLNKLQIY